MAIVALGIIFSTTANAAFIAVTSGNWSSTTTWGGPAPTATVAAQDITIPVGINVTLDADVTFVGVANSFIVNGTLVNSTTNGITITQGVLAGSGTISINRVTFATLGTITFSGVMNLKRLINSTTALAFVAIANISDTLDLQAGSLLLNTNSNLAMLSNSTVKVSSGSLTIGGGIFNSSNAYNVMYTGSSKVTGIELNTLTLQNAYLNMTNNTQTVTLSNNAIINANMNVTLGKIALNGKVLTLKGNLNLAAGSNFISTPTSDLTIQGTGTLNSPLTFDPASSINDLTINRTATGLVKIASPLNVSGHLNLMNGDFSLESGSILTMTAASIVHVESGSVTLNTGVFTGTASYNVEYMGAANSTGGIELNGTGLNNVMVNYVTTANMVTINSNASITGTLSMIKGMLNLNGKNLTLNGAISQNVNSQFIGNPGSELNLNLVSVTNDTLFFDNSNLNNQTLSKLKVNTTGTIAIVLGSRLVIANELNLTLGKIEIGNNDLVIMSAALITGSDDTKYIITSQAASGSLVMNVVAGSSYVTFPIGTSINYSPAYVQQNASATTGSFSVRAMNTVLSGGTVGILNSASLKVVDRTWFVYSGVSSINVNLKFGWVILAELNGFNRTNAYVSHFTNSAWDNTAAANASVGLNNTFELSRMGLTSLSPFAVTENGQPLGLKEISISTGFELYPNPSKDVIHIKLINSSSTYKYELTDITGRTILSTSNSNDLTKFEISNLGTGCYFIKATNLTDNTMIVKRFIKD